MKTKSIKRILWMLPMVLLTLGSNTLLNEFQIEKKKEKLLNLSIASIEREVSKLHRLNFNYTLLFDYDAKDILLIHSEPLSIRLFESYDLLLKNSDIINSLNVNLYEDLGKFKNSHLRLSQYYNRQKNDFDRAIAKERIINELKFEKDILTAELDYSKGKINKNNLIRFRENAYRKYVNSSIAAR